MKLNIFARLNKLEEALKNKTMEVEHLNKNFNELRKIVLFQSSVFDYLNKQIKPVNSEVESPEDRAKRSKREWYQRNKDAILERRKIANNIKSSKVENNPSKTYYWKNREKVLEYGRKYYLNKKAKTVSQKLQEIGNDLQSKL